MGKKVKHIPSRVPQKKMPSTTALMDQMVALYNGGQWDLLVTMATNMTKLIPSHIFGWRALSKALLMSGKPSEAINALIEFAKLSPNDPDIYSDLAHAHRLLGQIEEAEKNYRLVIKIDPTSAVTHNRLGSIYCDAERFSDAEKEFHRAVEIDPAFIQAHINLGYATETLGRWDDAEVCYRNAITLNPNYSEAHKRLGNLLALISRRRAESVISFERAIELNPGDANLYVSLGNVFLAEKNTDKSLAMFRRARQLEPLISWPSKQTKADFSVLLLDAPEAGCTPVSYLVGRTNYESHFVALIMGEEYDIDFLRSKADVIFNMISDADNGKEILQFAVDIADRIGRPTVNHPRHIFDTDRETIAGLLAGIEYCRIPNTIRLSAEVIARPDWQNAIRNFKMPLLIRCAGTHGGDDFEKINQLGEIDLFVARHPNTHYYLSEFVDYSSADGLFRKYRLIFLNDKILPYHLAIHDDWLVHHFRTDMANQEWMRKEEEAFLNDPHQVFNEKHYTALKEVAAAIKLDYCGIDCALDREGNIVVFEANATMRVHDEKNSTFAYKNPYIDKIKIEFDLMLANKAAIAV